MTKEKAKLEVKTRVKYGAKLLDYHHPGWQYKIDLGKLDMEYFSGCVAGQLGERNLSLNCDFGFRLGALRNERITYKYLTKLWKKEIKKRR